MHPDSPITKRDLDEVAKAIVGEVRGVTGGMNERFDTMHKRFDEIADLLFRHEALLIIIARKLDIPDADIDRALTPPPRP